MAQNFATESKGKGGIQEIVFSALASILATSKNEFRAGYTNITEKNGIKQEVYVPDSMKVYCQEVESLCDVLAPHFDVDTKTFEEDILKQIEALRKENNYLDCEKFTIGKLLLIKKMFRQLNFLLKKKSYLGGFDFIESEDGNEDVNLEDTE